MHCEIFWTPAYDENNIQFTYPSDGPIKKIDYVMFLPAERWNVYHTEAICNLIASDHCAYLVTLELLPAK